MTQAEKDFVSEQIGNSMKIVATELKNINNNLSKIEVELKENRDKRETDIEKSREAIHDVEMAFIERMQKTDEELLEYKFLKKYPRAGTVIIVLYGLLLTGLALAQFGVIG